MNRLLLGILVVGVLLSLTITPVLAVDDTSPVWLLNWLKIWLRQNAWYFNELCLDGDCITLWPSVSPGEGGFWTDEGDFLQPNTTFADDIRVANANVTGKLNVTGNANFTNVGVAGVLSGGSPLKIGSDVVIQGQFNISAFQFIGDGSRLSNITINGTGINVSFIILNNSKIDDWDDINFSVDINGTNIELNWLKVIGDTFLNDLFAHTYNWTTGDFFNSFNGSVLLGNETTLNATIDARLESTIYLPISVETWAGTYDDGDVSSINVSNDDLSYNVSENGGSPPVLTVVINWTGVSDFQTLLTRLQYAGGSGHEIEIGLWDWDSDEYEEEYGDITDMDGFAFINIPVLDSTTHISPVDGNVSLRLRHVQNGNPAHELFIDYAALIQGFTATTISDHDALSGRDDKENHPWALPTDASREITGQLNITNNLNVTQIIYTNQTCYTTDCSARIYHNGTGLIIES